MAEQVTGVPLALYDTRHKGWYSLDIELLRLGILGTKKLIDVSTTTTIDAGATSSPAVTIWSSDSIAVIKKIEVSGVTPSSLDITVDGVTYNVKSGDFEAEYGTTIYGTIIQVKVNVATAPTAATSVTIRATGYEAGKAQVPLS